MCQQPQSNIPPSFGQSSSCSQHHSFLQAQGRVVPRCACGVGEGFGAALGEITCCWDQLGPLLLRMAQRGELQGGHTQQGSTLGLRRMGIWYLVGCDLDFLCVWVTNWWLRVMEVWHGTGHGKAAGPAGAPCCEMLRPPAQLGASPSPGCSGSPELGGEGGEETSKAPIGAL